MTTTTLAAAALAAATAATAAGCGAAHASTSAHANGCVAVASGSAQGRHVITYSVDAPAAAAATTVRRGAAIWNSAGVHVLLDEQPRGGTIRFVTATGPTRTDACSGHSPRTVTVYLNARRFGAAGTPASESSDADLVAREIGHALGLARGGPCSALMTGACKTIAPAPDAAEIAEINHLYP